MPLFTYLKKANTGDFDYVNSLTDEEVNKISPYVLLGWGNGANQNNEIHTVMTDSIMNDKVFKFNKHPRLLLKLFMAANCDIDSTKYSYIKHGATKASKSIKYIAAYYKCSLREARDYARILTPEDIKEITKMMEVMDN